MNLAAAFAAAALGSLYKFEPGLNSWRQLFDALPCPLHQSSRLMAHLERLCHQLLFEPLVARFGAGAAELPQQT
eukprot:3036329-Rhodomonas_salina.1